MARAADRLVGLLLLALAVYTIAAARHMGYLQGRIPGPGFAPFWIGVGLAVAALAVLAGTWRYGKPTEPDTPPEPGAPTEPGAPGRPATLLATAAVTVAAVALVGTLGLLAALGLMLLAQVRIFGGTWRAAVLTAIALPLVFHVLFALWFKVQLPPGPWGF
ncbi:MAG: tripartite tricarboxylate transporter TctB family protein [bacterium]|nr:tripartite tricarboxylate transporter TctB family protein [bacterium]